MCNCDSFKLTCSTAYQFLLPLAAEPTFPALWASALHALAECTKPRSEELAEAVPEALKNMLLVMAAQGVLTPAWTVRSLPGLHKPSGFQVTVQFALSHRRYGVLLSMFA